MSIAKTVCAFMIVALMLAPVTLELLESDAPVSSSEEFRSEKSKSMDEPYGYPDLFAAYQRDIRGGDGGPAYPLNHRMVEFQKSVKALKRRGSTIGWQERGPGNVGGRTRGLIVDPDDPSHNTWFVGSVGGGVWKTSDAGETWRALTDHLPNLGVSSMEMAEGNHDIIYIGTGEGFFNVDAVNGSGMFKTMDRGETWIQLASTATDANFRHVNRLAVDPSDADVVVAATNTGIYRTTDGGNNWMEVYKADARVQDLRARPDNFNIQFATENSTAVLRSTDGGVTWQPSLQQFVDGVARIELAIAPSNFDVVYASAELSGAANGSSLYRSNDSGETWAPTIDTAVNPSNWLGAQGWYDQTIAVHPFSPDTVYLGGITLWKSTGLESTSSISAPTSLDQEGTEPFLGFVNFTSGSYFGGVLQTGDTIAGVTDVDEEDFVSIEIRFGSGSQKAHRYSVAEDAGANGNGGAGVAVGDYKYEDYVDVPFQVWDIDNNRQLMFSFRDQANNGVFDLIPQSTEGARNDHSREYMYIHHYEYDDTQPNASLGVNGGIANGPLYFLWPVLAPSGTWDADNLPESILRITFSTVVGQDRVTVPLQTPDQIHVDHHNILIIPVDAATNEFKILNANDGGVYFSEDGGYRWKETDRGYNTAQFYGVDKRPGFDVFMGGTQDNGTWRSYNNPHPGQGWLSAFGGDGFDVMWHSQDENLVVGSIQFNNIQRSTNGGVSWTSVNDQFDDDGQFITTMDISKEEPDRLFTSGSSGIWRSEDFGLNWVPIRIPPAQWGFALAGKVRVSLANPKIVWAGHRLDNIAPGTGTIHVSIDRGQTFSPVQVPILAPPVLISGLATHPHDGDTGYALFSAVRSPKILKTTDFGETWTDLSGFANPDSVSTNGFPDVAVYDLLVMPRRTHIIWAATEIGLFVSNDHGESWSYADNGLPAVSIWRMRLVDDTIVLATHGRGIWSVALAEAVATEDNSTDIPVDFHLSQNYPNPFNATTTISFDLPEQSNVKLDVFDVTGRKVATLTDEMYGAGEHKVNWNAGAQASGVYFCRLQASNTMRTMTMTLVK